MLGRRAKVEGRVVTNEGLEDYHSAGSVLPAASAPDWTGFGVNGAEAGGGGFEAHGMEMPVVG